MSSRHFHWLACVLLITGCALLQVRDPLEIGVAGITPIEGQGMELRMLVALRVQNPNDLPIDYNGVALQMNLQGKKFATGVSDQSGTVPRFGETVISVPVTISAFRIMQQALWIARGRGADRINYDMQGKLVTSTGTRRFSTRGDLDVPSPTPNDEER